MCKAVVIFNISWSGQIRRLPSFGETLATKIAAVLVLHYPAILSDEVLRPVTTHPTVYKAPGYMAALKTTFVSLAGN